MNQIHKKYKDWKKVPMPKIIADLPTDSRGYPIPANVSYLDGKPVFAANDAHTEIALMKAGKCSATGAKLDNNTLRLIGAPLNGLGKNKIIVLDAPVHVDALAYSMKVCPYLCLGQYYKGFDMDKADKFNEKYADQGMKFLNTSPVNTIPPFMLEIHPKFIEVYPSDSGLMYGTPLDDVLSIQFWRFGEVISYEKAFELILPYLEEEEIKNQLIKFNITRAMVIDNMETLWKKQRKPQTSQ